MKTKRCNRPFKGARGSQTRCIATRCGQKEFDRAGAFRNVVFFAPPSRLGLQRPALESSFPQFLPGFALTRSDLVASAWLPTGPRSGSGFWRRKTCCLDFVKVKESAASPAQLLHWCSRFRGGFLHIEFILSAELPWHTSA